jgi:hypothetical protein
MAYPVRRVFLGGQVVAMRPRNYSAGLRIVQSSMKPGATHS